MTRSEKPRSEPEIIPPGRRRGTRRERVFTDARSTERIYVARIRPFGVLGILMVGVLSAVALALLLGALLISLPLVIAFIAGATITCRAAAAPDRPGFHLPQAVGMALQ